jgi:hypothetical protein
VAISSSGKIVGVSNEGRSPVWPANIHTVTVRAKAPELAQLVQEWAHQRPGVMTGLIWYRLPVSTDHMNWRWPTLAAVMQGKIPRSSLLVKVSQNNPYDVLVINDGEQDELMPAHVSVQWENVALVADDAINGFALENNTNRVTFWTKEKPTNLAPGEIRVIGWLRLASPTKIYASQN